MQTRFMLDKRSVLNKTVCRRYLRTEDKGEIGIVTIINNEPPSSLWGLFLLSQDYGTIENFLDQEKR